MEINPKKKLGQNFLINDSIADKITDSAEISESDVVLEIGPGTGKLTEKILLKKPKKIIVIEKDKNLVLILKKKFGDKIHIINEDVLEVKIENISKHKIIVLGNLPYNISTKILVKFIKIKNLNKICKNIIFMFQKEVADRIVANFNDSNYGRISILSSWKLNIKKIKNINPGSFYPAPKVVSTILEMKPKEIFFKLKNANNLEYITSVFFKQRRKMIKKPLIKLFNNHKIISNKLKINLDLRPQNLEPVMYFNISKEYEKLTD